MQLSENYITKEDAVLLLEAILQETKRTFEEEHQIDDFDYDEAKINSDIYCEGLEDAIFKISKMECLDKDALYRKLWANHVQEDVLNHSRALDKELNDDGIKKVVDRYVYHGDYDCNLSYWDNIENLIDEAYENKDYRFAEPEEELEL